MMLFTSRRKGMFNYSKKYLLKPSASATLVLLCNLAKHQPGLDSGRRWNDVLLQR